MSYLKLKESHGYVNVGRGNNQTTNNDGAMYAEVQTTCLLEKENINSDEKKKSKIPKKEPVETPPLDNGYSTPNIPISPPVPSPHHSSEGSPPPPLPSRNYDEEDFMDGTPPPPLPERTDLSEQLLSPSKMQQYLYSSNASAINHITLEVQGTKKEKLSQDEILYDEPIIKPKVSKEDPTADNVFYDEIPPALARPGKIEFMIAANPSSSENIKGSSLASPVIEKVIKEGNDGAMYDEVTSPTANKLKPLNKTNQETPPPPPPPRHSSSPSPTHSTNPPPSLPSPLSPPLPPPSSVPPPPLPPRDLSPPPLPPAASHSPKLTKQRSHAPIVAYHVTQPVTKSSLTDDGLMTVSHTRKTAQTLLPRRQLPAPELPPRKASSVRLRRKNSPKLKKADTFDGLEREEKDPGEYDHLVHAFKKKGPAATLPHRLDDPCYSKLQVDKSLLMRSGVTIEGSLMSASNSSIPDIIDSPLPLIHAPNPSSPVIRPRLHDYEDLDTGVDPSDSLIHAPNAPSANIKPRSHDYEDPDEKDDSLGQDELIHAPNAPSPNLKPRPHNYEDLDKNSDGHIELVHAPNGPASSPSLKNRSHTYEDLGDKPTDDMIHAPNPPKTDIKPAPHLYESIKHDETEDMPTLVWDNSDMKPGLVSGFDSGGKTKVDLKTKKRKTSGTPLAKPESVSDEDFERRLERLENHYYPEIDIPLWPVPGGESSAPPPPRRASDIKQVVRNSWNVSAGSNGLPPGWKREVNEQGQVFYWHLPTGNIQYTKPEPPNSKVN